MTGFDVTTQSGQGRENLYHYREFSIATELTTTGSPVATTEPSFRRPARAMARTTDVQRAPMCTQLA